MRIAAILFATLFTADAITKAVLPNMAEGGGHQGTGALSFGLVPVALAVAFPWTRIPASLCAAGMLGNMLWQLRPAGVPNVFVSGAVSYNVADVCLVIGGYATALMIVSYPVALFVERHR